MREDMSRVIVERPRLGGDRGRKGRAVPLDNLPKQEGMRRRHVLSGDCKMLNENLSPLRRYLERQIGRPWDKIYSEIARHLRTDNTVQQHVRDHLSDFVAVRPRRRSGALYTLGGGKEPYDRLWFEPLYVDPKDGLLKRTDRLREARAFHRTQRIPSGPPDRIGLTPDRELRRIDGLWFEVTLAPLPDPEYRVFRETRKIPLKHYASRSPVIEVEKDLGTKLDWVAVDHWNTEHPHVHIIIRGRTDDGQDLVIDRDYIKQGMRDRAQDLITQELGPRTDQEIRQTLERQIDSERWTNLDRQLSRDAYHTGVIDMAPHADRQPDEFHALKVGRLRKLEALGLADQVGPGQWALSENAEATLRELGERGDIIKRIHRGLTERGIERGAASYVLASESLDVPVIGRLVDRGLDDELRGTAYAVVDGVDGRTHHIKLPDLDAAGDSAPGSIVELRKFDDAQGRRRVALAVRSDLAIEQQITATGATWLDRQAIAREPVSLGGGGFGVEVREAMNARAEELVRQGLAERQARGITFSRNLIDTLRRREVAALGEKLAAETGRPFNPSASGEYVAGTYQRRLALASGRFAMIDDGLGFQLVPWSPSLEKQIGRHVSGVARDDGGVEWGFGRKRGLGL